MNNRVRALSVLVAVFLVGGALGAGASYYWASSEPSPPVASPPDFQTIRQQQPPMRDPGSHRIKEILQLTSEQDTQFGEITADLRKQIESIRSEEISRIQTVQKEMNRRISEILTEEQKKKYEEYMNSPWQDRRSGGRRNSNNDTPNPSFPPSSRR